ncbi:hypothetical protein N7478_001322 [Penicillium angulare]|uniref:uncharacterized protein n=1 Tax=Penicillium angulare TaxID=116970 RepID=UPI0025408B7E|nr:uncharacterized protein N7478_001322 [Penicillium angulare]KAJ5292071.1 hypothetical protein N7478_001322 [Penicillium angulare]
MTNQVNFFVDQEVGHLCELEPLRKNLQQISSLLESYTAVINCNGSLARHLNFPLFSSRMESRVSGLFSSLSPCVVESSTTSLNCNFNPSWTDLICAEISPDQFESCGGLVRCCVWDKTIEMRESDRATLCSGVLQKLLLAPAEAVDVEKEHETRLQIITDLNNLQGDVMKVDGKIRSILRMLQEKDHTRDLGVPPSDLTYAASGSRNSSDTDGSPSSREQCEISLEGNSEIRDDSGLTGVLVKQSQSETSSPRRISSWTASERGQLRAFLASRKHMSWSRIAQEYEQEYHKGRSASSISGQARTMGVHMGCKSKKQRSKTARTGLLVLKVDFGKDQPDTNNRPADTTVANPTLLEYGMSKENTQRTCEYQPPQTEMASVEETFPVSADPELNICSDLQSIASQIQSPESPPGPFRLILN